MTEEQLPGGGNVFGIGRRKTQGQLARAELNQGVGHLRQAATYAARGAGATVGPRVRAAQEYVAPTAMVVRDRAASGLATTAATLAPLAVAVRKAQAEAAGKAGAGKKAAAARTSAMSKKVKAKSPKAARRRQRRSRGMLAGLLAAGAVAGVAGALAVRRRREQQEWTEYDPGSTLEPMRDEVETMVVRTPVAGRPAAGSDPTGGDGPKATGARANGSPVTDASTMSSGSPMAGGPTGAGSSPVAGGDSASTTRPGQQPVIHATTEVPSVAEGARDVSGRPADDLTTALDPQGTRKAKSGSRR
ncbi:hypothetical protein AWW66_16820 [Micromonospora rosaria]|uniref:Uncharacterized protein n=1 Tax=Micromonospora rosaria TaxID=47874 RepID=A0A136PQX1_9ACTN|nr:hypothetical protein [Micromonospora rosaria]KXK60852.1 hypothetical protein AWW66_16820 [Micromonospora rosaria]